MNVESSTNTPPTLSEAAPAPNVANAPNVVGNNNTGVPGGKVKIIERIRQVVHAPESTTGWVVLISVLVILVAGLGVGIYFLVKKLRAKNDEEPPAAAAPVISPPVRQPQNPVQKPSLKPTSKPKAILPQMKTPTPPLKSPQKSPQTQFKGILPMRQPPSKVFVTQPAPKKPDPVPSSVVNTPGIIVQSAPAPVNTPTQILPSSAPAKKTVPVPPPATTPTTKSPPKAVPAWQVTTGVYALSSNGVYLTTVYNPAKPAGTQCDMTTTGTTDKSKASAFKFEKKDGAWTVSVDCDQDGKWTSFLSEDGADLIQTREKDATKVSRQRWIISCKGTQCSFKNQKTGLYLAKPEMSRTETFWKLDPIAMPQTKPQPPKPKKTQKQQRPPNKRVQMSIRNDPTPVSSSGNDRFPPGALNAITQASGLSEAQVDAIMQLIMQFEQSDTRWWLYYGYCRALSYDWNKKDRGITLSLYGATTYKGSPGSDGYRLVQAYGKTLQQMGYVDDKSCCQIPGCKKEKLWSITRTGKPNPDDDSEAANIQQLSADCPFCKTISGLNDDPAWRTAVWKAFTTEYWLPAIQVVKASKLPQKAAVYGFAVDWALNEGAEGLKKGMSKVTDVASAVATRAKTGKCCNDGAQNAEKRAAMWGEAIATNPDLIQSVDGVVSRYKPG